MLVEHTFVTTREWIDAAGQAAELLQWIGYRVDAAAQDGPQELTFVRGREKVGANVAFDELPQSVHLGYDRGRVSVAASVREHRKVDPLHRQMLLSVVSGLEAVLVRDEPIADAAREHQLVLDRIHDKADKARRKRNWALGCVVTMFLALLALVISAALMS